MRNIITFIVLFFLCSHTVVGQKYKDIFPQIIGADDDTAFEILHAYIQSNLDHPNANLRLARIYIKRYKEVNVLREYAKASALAQEAKWRLLKAKIVITEKEVRKNSEYYFGFIDAGSAPTFSGIREFIKLETDVVDEFFEKSLPIYNDFVSSVEKYDEAVKNYAGIVGSYTSLKELYLLYDSDLINRLNDLKESYDSTKIYFNNYLEQRNRYSINAVQQTITENDIKVYRLDGLVTQINFLQPTISLWDYSAWADSVTKVVESTIRALRTNLIKNEQRLKMALQEVNATADPEIFINVYADKSLIFNLKKYDYKNAIVPLLMYAEFKQQLIKEQKRAVYFDTASISQTRKLAYYTNLINAVKQGDSIINDFETKFNPIQLKRHQQFIDATFGSTEQMKVYMGDQKKINNKLLIEQANSIKEGILSITRSNSSGDNIKFKRSTIPTYMVDKPIEELPLGQIKTNYILTSADESTYYAGLQITDAKRRNHEVAIAKFSNGNKPVWVRTIDLEIDSAGVDATHWLGDVKLTSQGIVVVIRSIAFDSSKVVSTLLHFTDAGKIKFATRLNTELFPREINYVESSNMFVVAFFAEKLNMDPINRENLAVMAYNGQGEELWKYSKTYNGDYRQMISTQNSILIGGNYTSINNGDDRTYTTSGGTNAYIISLSMKGDLQDLQGLVANTAYVINTIYKVNDKNINLLGENGVHIIINSDLEMIYSSVILK